VINREARRDFAMMHMSLFHCACNISACTTRRWHHGEKL
jgi:hypothetical protein